MFELVVKEPFGGYDIGQEITDPAEIGRILASHLEHHVVKRFAKDAPPTAAQPEPAPSAPLIQLLRSDGTPA